MPVTLDDIRAAAKRIAGAVESTPFVHSRTLSKLTGAEIFLKFENLQLTAALLERGGKLQVLEHEEDLRAGQLRKRAAVHERRRLARTGDALRGGADEIGRATGRE